MLSGASATDYTEVSAAWFARSLNASVAHDAMAVGTLAGATGPTGASVDDLESVASWIVRLTEQAVADGATVANAEHYLDQLSADFQVVHGLGLPGQLLVESFGSPDATRSALESNPNVAYFEPNSVVYGQAMPNDPEFVSRQMTGLHNEGQFGGKDGADINAPEAWDMNTGSVSVVVGVIDSGIDAKHPDLYLNIWLNQGEIPEAVLARIDEIDVDPPPASAGGEAGDGLITFYDLNKVRDEGRIGETFIKDYLKDYNGNGYLDALDLLENPRWADGLDTDRNEFVDDFFGVNFRQAADESFAQNNPSDVLGHGTHVAGTIGAMGNNRDAKGDYVGVVGINWRTWLPATIG